MSFRDTAVMFTPRTSQALTPHRYEYTRTSTCRDWSKFDRPTVQRMTAKRYRTPVSKRETESNLSIIRQAG